MPHLALVTIESVVMAYFANSALKGMDATFDTDSSKIGVNTCVSSTMFGNKDLFKTLCKI